MFISTKQFEQLIQVYNGLLEVNTCGENSFKMTDCLRLLEHTIFDIQNNKEDVIT